MGKSSANQDRTFTDQCGIGRASSMIYKESARGKSLDPVMADATADAAPAIADFAPAIAER